MFKISLNQALCHKCEVDGYSDELNLSVIENPSEINLRINDELLKDHLAGEKVIKLLLLGPSESGKSTILKQMRIIHLNGYTTRELWEKRVLIFKTVISAVAQLLTGVGLLGLKLSDTIKADVRMIRELSSDDHCPQNMPLDVHYAIKRIWEEEGVQEAYGRRNEFYLMDWAKHFIESIDRIANPHYIPTVLDVLYMRVETIGITEINYRFNDVDFRIFDVGGERTQRRKWIHLFDNVNALFFITAISDYDKVLVEDENMNRLQDTLMLFKSIGNHEVFRKIQIILFLNKKDLFMEKISKNPLTVCFPNYKYKNDFKNTTLYIKKKFEQQIEDREKAVYSHLTCATDTTHVNFVMTSITDMIISKQLKGVGV